MTTVAGGVVVPAAMCRQVARWVLAGVRAEVAAERDHGGPPFPAAPYMDLHRALLSAASAVDGTTDVTPPPARLLSTREAGRHLGLGARRIRQLAASGRVPARKLGRQWWITMEEPGP